MKVRPISIDDDRYIDFVKLYGSIFNSNEWLSMFGDDLMNCGVYNGDELVAVFYVLKMKLKGIVSVYSSPFFTPDNGLVIANSTSSTFKYNNFNKKVLAAVTEFIKQLKIDYIQFILPDNIIDTQLFIWSGLRVTPAYSYLIDLSIPIEDICKNINPKMRYSHIDKAIKDGVEVKLVKDYSIVKELVMMTFNRQNIKTQQEYIDKILFKFANDCNSFAHVAYYNDRPSAALFVVYDMNRSYCILSGFDASNEHRGSGSLVHYSAIKHAKELGIKVFDFEGSMMPHIENFFRSFGGKLTPKFIVHKQSRLFSILSIFRK